jgi:transposase
MEQYIQGTPRDQQSLLPPCVGDYIDADSPLHALDAFVDTLDLPALGFSVRDPGTRGRTGYDPATLVRLYLWGYLRRTRSSRGLEAATKVNLEAIWLTGDLHPDHSTISEFRKANAAALPGIFSTFTVLCVELGLYGRELIAIDGTFIKAVNSKAKSFTRGKLEKLIATSDAATARYLDLLETTDREETKATGKGKGGGRGADQLKAKIEKIRARKTKLQGYLEDCEKSPTGQVNLTDPDSVQLRKNGVSTVGYNIQAAVDTKHHMVAAVELTQDGNDKKQLDPMAQKAKAEMGLEPETPIAALADSGYPTGAQLAACAGHNTTVTAPVPKIDANPESYSLEHFQPDLGSGGYTCPGGQTLHRKKDKTQAGTDYEVYSNPAACCGCGLRVNCTKSSYRTLKVSPHQPHVDAARERLAATPGAMVERGSIAEHPFGTIKAGNGYGGGVLCRGKELATAEIKLSFWSYNFKRALKVLGAQELVERIREIGAARLARATA